MTCTQTSLGIHPVWSVFAVRMNRPWALNYLLSAQWRLISIFAGRIYRFVGFVMCRLWAVAWQNQQNDRGTQQRLRSAWASAQSNPHEALGPQPPIECNKLISYAKSTPPIMLIVKWATNSRGSLSIIKFANFIYMKYIPLHTYFYLM